VTEHSVPPSRPARELVAIALGGALGALLRYGVSRWIPTAKDAFPWATFWTNIGGAFVLGWFGALMIQRFPARRYPRLFFAVGFLGAFTTFSTMAVESVTLVRDGHALLGIGYPLVSVGAGLAVAYAGIVAGRMSAARC
jgi:CrcB protein